MRTGNRGFTLLEVLIALTVCGICLAVVFQAFSQALWLKTKAVFVDDATHLLGELLGDGAFVAEVLQRGGGTGPVPGADGWVFEAVVGPVEYVSEGAREMQQAVGMVALTLCVASSWAEGNRRCVTGWYRAAP